MTRRVGNRSFLWGAVALLLLGEACATGRAVSKGREAAKRNDWDTAVAYFREAQQNDPGRVDVKIALERATREAAAGHIQRARTLESQDQLSGALAEYRLAADLVPSNTLAISKALELERKIQAQVEASRPKPRFEEMRQQAVQTSPVPRLDPRTRVPLFNYPNAAVRDILSAISAVTNINFTYDQGLEGQLSRPYSINVQDVPLEEVLNQILQANTMTFKVLNQKTIFIYLDNPTNRQKYEDQYTQTFYLSHADIQEMVQIINTMLTTGPAVRPVVTQNKSTNSIVVRATAPVMGVIEQIITANDKPRAEISIDVEILEVSRTRVKQMGLDLSNWALGFTFSPELAPPNTAGVFPPGQPPPFNLNTISRGVSTGDFYMTVPSAVIKLLETDTRTKLLAKPQLRGREGATLTLNLGDQVPIAVTSFLPVAAGGVPTQPQVSYQYRPVGVNLTITPRVTYQDEVILDPIVVDKSAIGPNVDVAGQSIPSFVNRTAQVSMRLRDGESNLLAGLIKDEERKTQEGFPGINDIPILRSIFGNQDSVHDQSDLVMIVTPHIVRSREITTADLKPFYIGTGQNFGAGSAPSLISPDAPPAPATVGAGQPTTAPGQPAAPGAPPPPAGAPPAGLTGQPAQPPAGAQPPPAGTNKPNVVPIQPVENVPAPSALPPAQVILTTPGTEFQVGGGPYSVPLRITNVSQLGTITMTVTYDPKLLRATQVNQGSFMQGGGVTPTFAPKIDAAAGRIDIVISRGADRTGATGTGLLAAVVFDAIAPGQTKLAVTATALTATGQSIQVQTQGSAVTIK
jgi:type II secretory pathway component GspD/PulD (secretin)